MSLTAAAGIIAWKSPVLGMTPSHPVTPGQHTEIVNPVPPHPVSTHGPTVDTAGMSGSVPDPVCDVFSVSPSCEHPSNPMLTSGAVQTSDAPCAAMAVKFLRWSC